MKEVNLKSLAKSLNLSISTVSRALNDSYEISQDTKDRVFALARELNYQPNPYASSLRKRNSKTLAVIVPEIANNFFTLVINGIEEVAQANGYHVLIYITHESNLKEADYCRLMLTGRVDGVLLSLSGEVGDMSHITQLMDSDVPVVFFDRIAEGMPTVKVTTNNYESAYLGTQHLISRGCRNIAFLGAAQTHSMSKSRLLGYQDAMRAQGLPLTAQYVVHCDGTDADNRQRIQALLSGANRPDGIFAALEQPALLCYEVIAELGLHIPQDVKIVGFSNLRTAALLNPSLTTITQPGFDIGRQAARALCQILAKRHLPIEDDTIILPSQLMVRNSTAV